MKGKKALWIVLACLAVLIVILVLVNRSGGDEAMEADTTQTAEAADLTLWSVDAAQISAMAWTGPEGSLSVRRHGTGWVWEDLPGLDPDPEALASLAETLSTVTAARKLEAEGLNLNEFSLDEPRLHLSFTALGQEFSLDVGLRNGNLGQDYALYQGQVYLIGTELYDAFAVSPYSLAADTAVPSLTYTQVTSLTVTGPDGTLLTLRQPEDPEQYSYCDSYTWFSMDDQGNYTALGTSQVNSLLRQVVGLDLSKPVDLYQDLDQRPEASFSITVGYSESDSQGLSYDTVYTLCIGPLPETDSQINLSADAELDEDSAQEATVFVYEARFPLVYAVPVSEVSAILDTTIPDLLPRDVCPIPFSDLESLSLLLDGTEYTMDAVTQEDQTTYFLNGAVVDRSVVSGLYSQLTGLPVEAVAEDSDHDVSEADLQVKLYRNRETYGVMTWSLIPYDSSFYVVDFAGEQRLLVSIREADALLSAIRETVA